MEETKYLQEEVIDLRDLWFVFRQHIVAIILVALVVSASTFAVCRFLLPPTYSATSKIYVVSASSDSVVNLSDLQIGTSLTSDYQDLLLSRPMMESVIKTLDLDMTVTDLRKKIDITNPTGTRILSVTATMESAQQSADVANTVAKLSISWLPEVMECNAPNIAEEAIVNNHPTGPHSVRNAIIGAVVGAVLTYLAYVTAFLMDDTVITAEDMEKYFNLVPLASIPLAPELQHKKHSAKEPSKSKRITKGGRAQ